MKKDKKWRPPIKCRWFGHRWKDTEHKINVFFTATSPIERCRKCGAIRILFLWGYQQYVPETYQRFVEDQKIQNGEYGDNVVPFQKQKPD